MGALNGELEASFTGMVRANDLLIVGPGVLGCIVAEKWEATLNWNCEGSFLFTSSSAPYDCSDNGSCDEETPVVPIGRSQRTDVLLTVKKVVLEAGGCVVRLARLYMSFIDLE